MDAQESASYAGNNDGRQLLVLAKPGNCRPSNVTRVNPGQNYGLMVTVQVSDQALGPLGVPLVFTCQ